jgi:hypothetical protein
MISISQPDKQNNKITELSGVLRYLIENKEMCNSEVTCDLFLNYADQVVDHLYLEEKEVYRHLLNHRDLRAKNTTRDFFEGSLEIKKIFNQYLGRWCKNKKLRITKHAEFVQDTHEMFDLVQNRINAETTILYPLVREFVSDQIAA